MKTCERARGMKTFDREGAMKMRARPWFVLLVMIGMASGPAHAMTVGDAISSMADLLREGQLLQGDWRDGSWRDEQVYTGSIVTGLVSAARQTGMTDPTSDYLVSAKRGGLFIFNWASNPLNGMRGAYFGEEVYKGSVQVTGRRSPVSLYSQALASFDEAGGYDQRDAGGFIRLQGLRLASDRED